MIFFYKATGWLALTWFDYASLLFSGAGLAALGWLGKLISRRRPATRRQYAAPEASAFPVQLPIVLPSQIQEWAIHSGPSPVEIRDAIVASPPYSRDVIAQNFVGVTVDWTLELRQLLLSNDRRIANVRLEGEQRDGFPIIECEVELDAFRFLKFIHEGTVMRVTGTIIKASSYEIFLGAPNLTITPVNAKLVRAQ
jgi:hypothetical protein